jgi:hypothetical protein
MTISSLQDAQIIPLVATTIQEARSQELSLFKSILQGAYLKAAKSLQVGHYGRLEIETTYYEADFWVFEYAVTQNQ